MIKKILIFFQSFCQRRRRRSGSWKDLNLFGYHHRNKVKTYLKLTINDGSFRTYPYSNARVPNIPTQRRRDDNLPSKIPTNFSLVSWNYIIIRLYLPHCCYTNLFSCAFHPFMTDGEFKNFREKKGQVLKWKPPISKSPILHFGLFFFKE